MLHYPAAMEAYPVRRSWFPPMAELSPRREGPLHVGWQRVRAALRGAGLMPGLVERSLHARLGPHARVCPTPATVLSLIDEYLSKEARGRVDEGRILVHRAGERTSARQIAARLRRAVPELGMLALSEEGHRGRTRLVLRCMGAHAIVDEEEIETEQLGAGTARWTRRTVTVDALVVAVNELLATLGGPFRFLPMSCPEDANAYLAVDLAGAEVLDSIGFWDEPLDDLDDFASWADGTAAAAVA